MKLKKGHMVRVIAGNSNGATGEILSIDSEKNRVLIEGVNMRWKHHRPTQSNPKGERVQEATAIHASNVMRIDTETGKTTRKAEKSKVAKDKGA